MVGTPYAGAVCHVLNHGNRREGIFAGDQDRRHFLETLECRPKGDSRKCATGLGTAMPDGVLLEHDNTTN